MKESADQERDGAPICDFRRRNGAADAWPSSPAPQRQDRDKTNALAPAVARLIAEQQRSRRSLLFYAGRLAALNATVERLEQEDAAHREQAARDAKAMGERYASEIARLQKRLEASEAARREQESREALQIQALREMRLLQDAWDEARTQDAQALQAARERIGALEEELKRLHAGLEDREILLQEAQAERLSREEDVSSLRRRLKVYESLKAEQEEAIRAQQARLAQSEHSLQRHRAYFVFLSDHKHPLEHYFAEQAPWWKIAIRHPFAMRHWRALRRVQRIKALV